MAVTLEKKELHGKVKTLKKISYYDTKSPDSLWGALNVSGSVKNPDLQRKFNAAGFQVEVMTYDQIGQIKSKTVDEFDSKNQHILSKRYSYSPEEYLNNRTEYTYNNQGGIIEIKWFDNQNNLKTRQAFEYNADHQVVKQTQFKWDGNKQWYKTTAYGEHGHPIEIIEHTIGRDSKIRKTFTYDKTGNRTSSSTYNPDGSLKQKKAFMYNAKGQLIEIGGYISGEYHLVVKRKYNEQGKLTEELYYNIEGIPDGKRIQTYDNQGSLTKNTDFDAEGQKTWSKTYNYRYDKANNWILKMEDWRDQTTLIKREITYFD